MGRAGTISQIGYPGSRLCSLSTDRLTVSEV